MGSKKLSKHGCGVKRRRSESRLFLGSPRCRENPEKIGSLNPQFHLHSSVPSSGRSRVLNPVRRTSVRQPHYGELRLQGLPLAFTFLMVPVGAPALSTTLGQPWKSRGRMGRIALAFTR